MIARYNRRQVVEDFVIVYEVKMKASNFQRFQAKPGKAIGVR